MLTKERCLNPAVTKLLGLSKGMREGKGFLYKAFFAGFESPLKKMLIVSRYHLI